MFVKYIYVSNCVKGDLYLISLMIEVKEFLLFILINFFDSCLLYFVNVVNVLRVVF